MDWLLFQDSQLKGFIEQSQKKLNMNLEEISKILDISSRTLRDWKREKYKPSKELILKLAGLSTVPLPPYQVISQHNHIHQIAKKGGCRRYELHGPPGTKEGRSRGGRSSWFKRKNNPQLWEKYTIDP